MFARFVRVGIFAILIFHGAARCAGLFPNNFVKNDSSISTPSPCPLPRGGEGYADVTFSNAGERGMRKLLSPARGQEYGEVTFSHAGDRGMGKLPFHRIPSGLPTSITSRRHTPPLPGHRENVSAIGIGGKWSGGSSTASPFPSPYQSSIESGALRFLHTPATRTL